MNESGIIILSEFYHRNKESDLVTLWNEIVKKSSIIPDFSLSERNFYYIIQSLETNGLITSRRVKGLPPIRLAAITESGKQYFESLISLFSQNIPKKTETQENDKHENSKRKNSFTDAELGELLESIELAIGTEIFDLKGIVGSRKDRIDQCMKKIRSIFIAF